MTPGARLQAAIEILEDWKQGSGTAERLVEAYGRNHRFAGSRDRAAIGERVFAVFRRRGDLIAYMNDDTPRALVLGSLRLVDRLERAEISALCTGGYGPEPLEEQEARALDRSIPEAGTNLPDWIAGRLARDLGSGFHLEIAAMQERAAVDLRVNRLKATPEEILARGLRAERCRYAPWGLRLKERADVGALTKEGLVEIQDEGSQIASHLVEARPNARIADLCAGGGGKSLCMGADMDNRGEIVVADDEPRRLSKLWPRARRAGLSIIAEAPLAGAFDRVLIDAPCSGSGTWRRAPDAPWRLTEAMLERLSATQWQLLDKGAALVAAGGRLIYVTCSLLAAENRRAIDAFLARNAHFAPLDWTLAAARSLDRELPSSCESGPFLALRPGVHKMDGFFVAILERRH